MYHSPHDFFLAAKFKFVSKLGHHMFMSPDKKNTITKIAHLIISQHSQWTVCNYRYRRILSELAEIISVKKRHWRTFVGVVCLGNGFEFQARVTLTSLAIPETNFFFLKEHANSCYVRSKKMTSFYWVTGIWLVPGWTRVRLPHCSQAAINHW